MPIRMRFIRETPSKHPREFGLQLFREAIAKAKDEAPHQEGSCFHINGTPDDEAVILLSLERSLSRLEACKEHLYAVRRGLLTTHGSIGYLALVFKPEISNADLRLIEKTATKLSVKALKAHLLTTFDHDETEPITTVSSYLTQWRIRNICTPAVAKEAAGFLESMLFLPTGYRKAVITGELIENFEWFLVESQRYESSFVPFRWLRERLRARGMKGLKERSYNRLWSTIGAPRAIRERR